MRICKFFRNFAAKMKKRLYILLVLCLLSVSYAHARTIILRTGARVSGTVVFENEEVVIIRNAEGARFQYPRAEIVQIVEDEKKDDGMNGLEDEGKEEATKTKKVSLLLELGAGAAVLPNEAAGGAFHVDMLVGSHHIGDKHMFLGGGFGYHGLFFGANKYHFMPIQVALRVPFLETKHAPFFGASVGYGIALSKNYMGGIYAGIDFGYRYAINPKTAVTVTFFTQLQQAKISTTEIIESEQYTNTSGRVFITPGIKLGLYF